MFLVVFSAAEASTISEPQKKNEARLASAASNPAKTLNLDDFSFFRLHQTSGKQQHTEATTRGRELAELPVGLLRRWRLMEAMRR